MSAAAFKIWMCGTWWYTQRVVVAVLLGTYSADYIFWGEIMATTSRHPANTENSAPIFPLFLFLHCNEVIIHTTKTTLSSSMWIPLKTECSIIHLGIMYIRHTLSSLLNKLCTFTVRHVGTYIYTVISSSYFNLEIKLRNIALDCG